MLSSYHFFFISHARLRIVSILLIFFISGCLANQVENLGNQSAITGYPELEKIYFKKARLAEQNEDYYQASFYWWILSNLKPDDFQANDRSQYLLRLSKERSQEYAIQGLSFIEAGDYEKSVFYFLKSLTYYPYNNDSIKALKEQKNNSDFFIYKSKSGQSLGDIVLEEYRNHEMIEVISHFNDIENPDEELTAGTLIKLIINEGPYRTDEGHNKVDNVKGYEDFGSAFTRELIERGEKSFQEKDFTSAMSFAEMVLKESSRLHPRAKTLHNNSGYSLAQQLINSGKSYDALQILKQIDNNFLNVHELLISLQDELNIKAEYHYSLGVEYFLAENLQQALVEWNAALKLNPTHVRAKKGVLKVEKMLDKLKELP